MRRKSPGRFTIPLLLLLALAAAPALHTQVHPIAPAADAVASYLIDCADPEPVVLLDELPAIALPGGTGDALLRKGPLAYLPAVTATATGFVIAGATGSSENRDILVAGLGGEGGVTFVTVIGGSGDDYASSIAVAADGALLIGGSTTSPDLVPGGRPLGGSNGFVVRIDPAALKVSSGFLLDAGGNETLSSIAVGRDGSLLLGGSHDGKLVATGSTQTITTLFPEKAKAERSYFVATADAQLTQPAIALTFEAAALTRFKVWFDCYGNPVIGAPPVSNSPCPGSSPMVYTMSEYDEDYDIDHDWNNPPPGVGYPPGGMGFHALRWKYYRANSQLDPGDPPIEVDWTLAPEDGEPGAIPKSGVDCYQAGELNALENIVFTQDGDVVNPRGDWVCDSHWHGQILALRAAYYATRWGSPTYAVLSDNDDDYIPVAVERTTFEVLCPFGDVYNGETLEDICDFTVNTVGELSCVGGDNGVSYGNFYFRGTRMETSFWKVLVWYIRGIPFLLDEPQVAWASGEHLFDPPPVADDPHGMEVIQAATERMLPRLVQPLSVVTHTYQGGALVQSQVGTAQVPLLYLQ
jgi:hypothetical protein